MGAPEDEPQLQNTEYEQEERHGHKRKFHECRATLAAPAAQKAKPEPSGLFRTSSCVHGRYSSAKVKLAVLIAIVFHSGKCSLMQYWDIEACGECAVQRSRSVAGMQHIVFPAYWKRCFFAVRHNPEKGRAHSVRVWGTC
jgi:hypothetical protein